MPEEATKAYVKEFFPSKRVIVIRRTDGVVRDVWVADGPVADLGKYARPSDTFVLRYWNGEPAAG